MSADIIGWHLVGNGPGPVEMRENERLIRFNQPPSKPEPADLTVSNGRVSGVGGHYIAEGRQPFPDFEGQLADQAFRLESSLRVRPSVGLTTLFALKGGGARLRLSRMNLLPSIARPENLPDRKPLACAYHNWLGERRLAMTVAPQCEWPSFWLQDQGGNETSAGSDPYDSLLSLPDIGRTEGRGLIKQLAQLSSRAWLTHATTDRLLKAEALFFLQREIRDTLNWWLFDHQASVFMAQIHRTLALAQLALYSPTKV